MGFVISFSFHVYISMLIVEARDEHCAVDRSRLVVPQYLVWPICFSFEMGGGRPTEYHHQVKQSKLWPLSRRRVHGNRSRTERVL